MAAYLTEIVVDLAMPPWQRPVAHQFAMGDNNAYTFTALLCDSRDPGAELMPGSVSGDLVRPDGETIALQGVKGNATRVVLLDNGGPCNATPCSVTLPQSCFAYPGRVTLTIKLIDGTTITQALSVSAVVMRTSTDVVVDPGQVVPDVADLQAIATELTAAVGGAVRFDEAQVLTDAEKAQARANIGADGSGLLEGTVRYDQMQFLSDSEKSRARANIGAPSHADIPSGVVRYDETQQLSTQEKVKARNNIEAASLEQVQTAVSAEATARNNAINQRAVRYDAAQNLTDANKKQAQKNMGAVGETLLNETTGYTPMYGTDGTDTTGRATTVTKDGRRYSIERAATAQGNGVQCFLPNLHGGFYDASGANIQAWCAEAYQRLTPGHRYRLTANIVSGVFPDDSGSVSIYPRNELGNMLTQSPIRLKDGVLACEFVFTGTYFAITAYVPYQFYTGSNNAIVFDLVLEELPDQVISGSNPVITAAPGSSYVCSESYVETLSFTPSATGICSVRFTSGTTPTVLDAPGTVIWPDWFDHEHLEASRTYEISIADGKFGAVTSWA